ncbi:MAG: DUF58 domain-containing protein [Pseudomonadota bacterium]
MSAPPPRRRLTPRGWALLLNAAALFLLATHFASNLAYALFALSFSLVLNALIAVWRGLDRTEARLARVAPVAEGEPAELRVRVRHASPGLRLRLGDRLSGPPSADRLSLALPPAPRGVHAAPEPTLVLRDLFGLAETSRPLTVEEMGPAEIVVHPRPDWSRPAAPAPSPAAAAFAARDGAELAGLRPFRDGDDPARIDPRASARVEQPVIREFEAHDGRLSRRFALDPDAPDRERELRRLASGILRAARAGERIALDLPQRRIPVGAGEAHLDRLLRALALA